MGKATIEEIKKVIKNKKKSWKVVKMVTRFEKTC
jgi:hypothetical protein